MRRISTIAAGFLTASVLLVGCGDTDGDTGDADAEVDSQIEGDRDSTTCVDPEAEVATNDTLEETGDDPAGSTETGEECTSGNEGDNDEGGDGESNSGGTPGVGTPEDDSGSDDSGGSDTGTGTGGG